MNNNELKAFIVQPERINILKSAGLTEQQRRDFNLTIMELAANQKEILNLEPLSVFNAVLKLVKLRLHPELGTGYIIPYGNKAQLQIGYKGYIQLAMNTGMYKKIDCVEVKEGDLIEFSRETNTHKFNNRILKTYEEIQNWRSLKTIGYRAFAIDINGVINEMFMFNEEIELHHKKYSKAYGSKKDTNIFNMQRESMDRKVVLKLFVSRHLSKSLNMSRETAPLLEALKIDSSAIEQVENREIINYIDNPEFKIEEQTGVKITNNDSNTQQIETNVSTSTNQGNNKPTDKQLDTIIKYKLHPDPNNLTFAQASLIIKEWIEKINSKKENK